MAYNPSSTIDVQERQGWTSPPDGRGTMNIITSCAITTLLCCWSALIVNIPSPESTRWSNFSRKLLLLGLYMVAPEVMFQVALGQWLSAKDSTKQFHQSGFLDWSLRHAFFVDMGGLHLRCPDHPAFPINSRQLHYLITRGYTAYPSVKEKQIRDRNKVDGTLRLITLIQILIFTINLLLRAVQRLAITVLELSTSAFVILSILTTVFWFQKPADVEHCEYIESNVSIATIQGKDDLPVDAAYTYTPLDCIGREEWSWSILWMHGLNCLRRLNLAGQPQQLPVQRVQNTLAPAIRGRYTIIFAIVSLAYLGIFVAGWNYSFPTHTEQILWRSASLTALISAAGVFSTQQIFFRQGPSMYRLPSRAHFPPEAGEGLAATLNNCQRAIPGRAEPLKRKFDHVLAALRNNSASQDPALDAPVMAVLMTWFFGFFYVSARTYLMVADVIELRSLPESAYQTLNWSSLAPYVP